MITPAEKEIIDLLVLAWNKFIRLDEQHPCDKSEFMDAIHKAQQLIMIRDARRNNPEIFPIYERENEE